MFGKCFFHVLRIFRDTLTHIIFRILIVYHPFSNNAICFCNKFVTFPVTFSVTSLYILFRICSTFLSLLLYRRKVSEKVAVFSKLFQIYSACAVCTHPVPSGKQKCPGNHWPPGQELFFGRCILCVP